MTKTNNITRTMVASILSLALLVTMFIGMTYAWFTDSVTSGDNKIQAGNLDIVFEYSKTLEEDSWKLITNETKDIFTDVNGNDILWEPGATNVVYLKIKNAGTLALKYNLGINVSSEVAGTNVAGNNFKLSNFIQFGQVILNENDVAFANREEAIAKLTDSKKISSGYTIDGSMLSGEEKIIALVVYMPDTTGENANYKTGTKAPEINMGITLLATQASYEVDGFSKYYDSSAAYESISTIVVENEDTVLKLGSIAEVIVPSDAKAGANTVANGDVLTLTVEPETTTPSGFSITTGSGIVTYDITIVNQEGLEITDSGNGISVKLYIGESGATDVKHIVNGVAEPVSFNVEGDYIIFNTGSFSPFVITSKYVAKIGDTKYENLQDALDDALNGETITLLTDIVYDNCDKAPLTYYSKDTNNISAKLDLNGKTISGKLNNISNISLINIGRDVNQTIGTSTLTIDDSTKTKSGTLTALPTLESDGWDVAISTVTISRNGKLIFNNGNIITEGGTSNNENPYGVLVLTNSGAQSAEFILNGGYIESKSESGMGIRICGSSSKASAVFTMNGGTIVGDGRGVWFHQPSGSGSHQLIDAKFNAGTIIADRALEVGDFNKDTDVSNNIKITINGGKFVSTNYAKYPTHPVVKDLFTSNNPVHYNLIFSHVDVVDNR